MKISLNFIKRITLIAILSIGWKYTYAATIVASGGDWTVGGSWVGGAVPVSGVDDVFIPAGVTITITGVVFYNGNVTIDGTLSFIGLFGRLSMNASSTVTINTGGQIVSSTTLPALTGIRIGANIIAYNAAIDGTTVNGPASITSGGLPITLVSFTADNSIDQIELSWATSYEENFSHFEIEKSSNGVDFRMIGEVESKGGLEMFTEYTYNDLLPFAGMNYYRLNAVDFDGTFEYSDIISIQVDGSGPMVQVFPNPVNGRFKLSMNFVPENPGLLTIYNFTGNVVFSSEVSNFQSEVLIPESIKKGTYLLRLTFNEFSTTTRIMIE